MKQLYPISLIVLLFIASNNICFSAVNGKQEENDLKKKLSEEKQRSDDLKKTVKTLKVDLRHARNLTADCQKLLENSQPTPQDDMSDDEESSFDEHESRAMMKEMQRLRIENESYGYPSIPYSERTRINVLERLIMDIDTRNTSILCQGKHTLDKAYQAYCLELEKRDNQETMRWYRTGIIVLLLIYINPSIEKEQNNKKEDLNTQIPEEKTTTLVA